MPKFSSGFNIDWSGERTLAATNLEMRQDVNLLYEFADEDITSSSIPQEKEASANSLFRDVRNLAAEKAIRQLPVRKASFASDAAKLHQELDQLKTENHELAAALQRLQRERAQEQKCWQLRCQSLEAEVRALRLTLVAPLPPADDDIEASPSANTRRKLAFADQCILMAPSSAAGRVPVASDHATKAVKKGDSDEMDKLPFRSGTYRNGSSLPRSVPTCALDGPNVVLQPPSLLSPPVSPMFRDLPSPFSRINGNLHGKSHPSRAVQLLTESWRPKPTQAHLAGGAHGITSPPRSPHSLMRRSNSLSMVTKSGEDLSNLSFLETIDDFYRQLVLGTKCTGPDVLAINERAVEIDLSAEFPPERREAQFDFQTIQNCDSAYMHPRAAITAKSVAPIRVINGSPLFVHHL